MDKTVQNIGLWAYLESTGVLTNGTDAEIKAAKKQYRKQYILNYKRNQRIENVEYSILLSAKNGELEKIKTEADRHKTTNTAFLKLAVLAYINKTFIVPDKAQVAQLEQLLMKCLNEIKLLSGSRFFKDGEKIKYELLAKRIEKLEIELSALFRKPPEIEEYINNETERNPDFKQNLIKLISQKPNDS